MSTRSRRKKPSLAIVVPMYNEEAGAEKCVRAITQSIQASKTHARLIAVNDGSRDKTREILDRLVEEGLPFEVLHLSKNAGYGGALVQGTKKADELGCEFVLFMDSDLTNDPALIPVFAEALEKNDVDVIKASRFRGDGGMQGVPWQRQVFSIVGNRVAAALFRIGVRDCTNGFRAIRVSMLRNAQFRERGFPIILEELLWLKRHGARFAEIPYVLTSRTDNDKATSFTYNYETLAAYWRYARKSAFVGYRKQTTGGT